MFGDDHGDHDHNGFSVGQLLFGLFLWRELESGRITAGDIFRSLFVIAAVLGGGALLLLAIVGASMPRYDTSLDYASPYTFTTEAPAYAPAWTPEWTWAPSPPPTAGPTPTPTPAPTPVAGLGKRVSLGGGWTLTATKVQRWTPSWYHEPGWRLITIYVTVGMPATEDGCLLWDDFSLTARNGTAYYWSEAYSRDPMLIACSDYHRRTTEKGWLTFEVRDKDAKGLVLNACGPSILGCEVPAGIRVS